MAEVTLLACSCSTFWRKPKSSEALRWRRAGIYWLNCVQVSSSGARIGCRGEARSSSVLEDFISTGLSKGKCRIRASRVERRRGRSWSSPGSTQREVVLRAVDSGNFCGRENAEDTRLEKSTGEERYQSFFRDQVYDYDRGNDLYLDYCNPEEGSNRVSGQAGKFIQNENFNEPFDAQGDAEVRRPDIRSQEWAQRPEPLSQLSESGLDGEGRRLESSVSQTKGDTDGNLDGAGQTSRRGRGLFSSPNPVSEGLVLDEDKTNSRIVFRNARGSDNLYERRGSPPYQLGGVEENRGGPAGSFESRYKIQIKRKDDVFEIEGNEQQDPVLSNSGKMRPERTSTAMYGRDAELEESARSVLYAKQVISVATAQTLGFVTQLWVDIDNLKVVALEVRPSLLFGDFCSFPLNSIRKVGDVVLIRDDDSILGERDLFNCSDLVGIDLFTEEATNLGKVRDYNFSLEDGAVLSFEFDSFGVPLIPSSLVRTYSLSVNEVVETQQDGLLVRRGAEKRVRTLSKGFLSRSKMSSARRQSPWKQQRSRGLETQYLGQTTGKVPCIAEWDNYSPGYTTPRQQPKRGNNYSVGKKGLVNESASRFETDRTTDVRLSSNFPTRRRDVNPEGFEDYETIPVRDSPQILENEQMEGSESGVSSPEISGSAGTLPISYRISRRRFEND